MRIIPGASLSTCPYAPGRAWHRLHYVLGLQKLGHEVWFVEELDSEACLDRYGVEVGLDESVTEIPSPEGLERRSKQLRVEASSGSSRARRSPRDRVGSTIWTRLWRGSTRSTVDCAARCRAARALASELDRLKVLQGLMEACVAA